MRSTPSSLARLQREGLTMSPEADRYTLVRRVSLDLIGLPPTPEEADAFVNDTSPDAYEKLVDRLLASPHYGERWARRWLDLARYADTNGYEKDRPRSIWPYRDWVIKALNADMPFDQFTIEQIAGDMLPNATLDAASSPPAFTATRCSTKKAASTRRSSASTPTVDRVDTTATVWLGLTLGCAQCHTHKYDPIPHHEYYQFMAFLNNADEPMIDVPSPELATKRRDIEKQIAAAEAALAEKLLRIELEHSPSGSKSNRRRRSHGRCSSQRRCRSNLPTLDRAGRQLDSGQRRSDQARHLRRDVRQPAAKRSRPFVSKRIPDPSLPAGGPGRVYLRGPTRRFLPERDHGERRRQARQVRRRGCRSIGDAKGAPSTATETGWSINGGQGKPQDRRLQAWPSRSTVRRRLDVRLIFEKYYAAAMGRFRISVTATIRDQSKPWRLSGRDRSDSGESGDRANRRRARAALPALLVGGSGAGCASERRSTSFASSCRRIPPRW